MDKNTKPGEKGFPVILLFIGIFITAEAVRMYKNAPELSGYGTMPLICGILMIVLSVFIIINNFRFKSEISGRPVKEQAIAVARHIFSKDVMIMTVFIIAYCIMLSFRIGFVIASPVFLWVSMTYLSKGRFVKNIFYTMLVMLFIVVVFNLVFKVVFP
ncbi:MAG: tripartite tricarboxylate transporter TctB family protein [Firmicutes bacterium]|nr:tripartite tricarboxylate transporter TctB family protein [Bacillota bacterium]